MTEPLTLRELSQSNIDTIDLGKFTPHKTKIKDVIHLIHKSRKADYSQRREALVEFCTSSLENGFNSKLRGGVIMQIANPAIRNLSSSISSTVVEGITNLFDDTQGQRYTASGDRDESIKAKIEFTLHRLFTKKQNPVEEEVVEERVAEEVEIKESVVGANNSIVSLSSEGGKLALTNVSEQIIYIDTSDKRTRFIDTEFDPILPFSNQEIIATSRMLYDTISKNRLLVDDSLRLISAVGGPYGRAVAGVINGTLIARDIKDGRYSNIIADGDIGMIPIPNRGINFNFARSGFGKGVLLPSGGIVSSDNTQLTRFVGNGKSNSIRTKISIEDLDPRILERMDPRFYKALEIMNKSSGKIIRPEIEKNFITNNNTLALVNKTDVYKNYPTKIFWTSESGTTQTYKIYQRSDIDWNMIRTRGVEGFIGKTNKEAALSGFSPELKDGNLVQIHHIGQDSRGPLVEVSSGIHTKYHKTLHGQFGGNKNPDFPVKHDHKWKSDVKNYWKWRAKNDE
jgi:hypothetical protein